jgi:molybdopterin converting factor small subunit
MVEVHLYGKLRRFTDNQDPSRDSIAYVPAHKGDIIGDIIRHIGIPLKEVGNNIFLNGEYSALEREVKNGDRLGIFPDDMQLLYKWYFVKVGKEEQQKDKS